MKSASTSDVLDRFKERKVGLVVESQYDPNVINHAAVVLKELLSERGHEFAKVNPELRRIPPSSLEVIFQVEEGPKVKVGEINIDNSLGERGRRVCACVRVWPCGAALPPAPRRASPSGPSSSNSGAAGEAAGSARPPTSRPPTHRCHPPACPPTGPPDTPPPPPAPTVVENLLSKEDLVSMDRGCVCCSLRNDIVKALRELGERASGRGVAYDAILLETTGLADPAPVAFTFFANPWISANYRLDSILCLVDAQHIAKVGRGRAAGVWGARVRAPPGPSRAHTRTRRPPHPRPHPHPPTHPSHHPLWRSTWRTRTAAT